MKPEQKTAVKAAGTFGLFSAGVFAFVGHPVVLAALVYGTYRVARLAYNEEKIRAKLRDASKDYDLFV